MREKQLPEATPDGLPLSPKATTPPMEVSRLPRTMGR
jgi:hypothetical protein